MNVLNKYTGLCEHLEEEDLIDGKFRDIVIEVFDTWNKNSSSRGVYRIGEIERKGFGLNRKVCHKKCNSICRSHCLYLVRESGPSLCSCYITKWKVRKLNRCERN